MNRLVFKIYGMDCAQEVAILKREIGPLVGDENNLSFDLLNGKMTVDLGDRQIDEDAIRDAVARTGMQAVAWDAHISQSRQTKESFWNRHGRSVMCVASGVCLVIGFAIHTIVHGWLDALTMGVESSHSFPLPSIAFYCAAMISGGWFIFPKAVFAARKVRPDMNLLMTVAVTGAVAIGEWFEGATVTFLFAVALLLESWSVARARRAIGALMDLSPTMARYIGPNGEGVRERPVEGVPVGVTALVRPGEKIPLDGVITKGSTSVNQAPITGESLPVKKEVGDEVFAGTINEDGAIEFRVTKASRDTTLARIIRLVEEAQTRRARSEQWVEKFAKYYTPSMMLLAIAISVIPPLFLGGGWYGWIYEALVILVIACPCALVISTPVSIVAGLSSAARAGILIKGGIFLEAPGHLKIVALDKTGTLTRGEPEVQEIYPFECRTRQEVLSLSAALEASSEHPLARAILRKAEKLGVKYSPAESFRAVKGKGAEGYIDGDLYWIGSHRMLHEKGGETTAVHEKISSLEDSGHSVVIVGHDGQVCGFLSIADELRPESKLTVAKLKELGIREVIMLTGDNKGTAQALAEVAGIDSYEAELLPEDKVKAVESLVREFKHVAMVGDGVNDAPAMAASSLGVAMGAVGTDAAIETADIALMSDDLGKLPPLIRHSRRTLRIIKQNIVFALCLKLVFIILALAGLATLWMAIAADMGASLLVIFNALRLLKWSEI